MAPDKKEVNKRAGHRAQATKIISNINTECNQDSPSVSTLEQMAQELDRQKVLISELDDRIQNSYDDETEVVSDISASSDRMMLINAALSHVQALFASYQQPNAQTLAGSRMRVDI